MLDIERVRYLQAKLAEPEPSHSNGFKGIYPCPGCTWQTHRRELKNMLIDNADEVIDLIERSRE